VHGLYKIKRVEDDIPDPVFGLGLNPIYYEPDVVPLVRPTAEEFRNPLGVQRLQKDPLLFRDSWMNRLYARGRFIRVPRLNIEGSARFDVNHQRQQDNTVSSLAVVLKADYTWEPWRALRVIPQVKWLGQRLNDDTRTVFEVKEYYFYPILRFEYPVSDRTAVKAGAQGFPFLKSRYRTSVIPDVDFDSRVYLLQVNNTSTYVGYQVNINLGYERRLREFTSTGRAAQDLDHHRLFLRVIAGLRPLF
jgi:hypothetical protein